MADEVGNAYDDTAERRITRSSLLQELNSVEVTVEGLHAVQAETDRLREDGVSIETGDGIYIAVSLFRNEPAKAKAVWFRLSALAEILDGQQAPGWTLPRREDGAVFTNIDLVKAAAAYPLSDIDGDIRFDTRGLLQKALELAEPEGTA